MKLVVNWVPTWLIDGWEMAEILADGCEMDEILIDSWEMAEI